MDTKKLRIIARSLNRIELMFEIQDRRTLTEAHDALQIAAEEIERLEKGSMDWPECGGQ